MLLWLLSKLLFIKYLPSNFYQAPEQLVLCKLRARVPAGSGQDAHRGAEQQRRLCNRQIIRRQAVREDGRALFPGQGEAAAAWHRGVLVQLRAVWRHERAGYVADRIDGACGRGLLD